MKAERWLDRVKIFLTCSFHTSEVYIVARQSRLLRNKAVFVLGLPDVLEHQELSLDLLSKRIMSLILEKHLVVLKIFLAFLKIRE